MNTPWTDPRHPWTRLTAAARTVRDERGATAPFGFATRVVALALAQDRRMGSLFEVFALRALGVACILAICSVALNYGEVSRRLAGAGAGGAGDDALLPMHDAVAVVLALAD